MKHYYLLFLLFFALTSNAQTNCDDASAYLVNAYSHVKDAYDSNNISHLKYYANRSVESFKLSKKTLDDCDCKTALELAEKGMDLLVKVEDAETFEDGRFYVKRARDISKKSVIEIDKCAYNNSIETPIESNELTNLQSEQLKLQQQQEALKLKEEELKTKLAEQKGKALILQKKQLILNYENAIVANIKTYNETLNICDCNHEILKNSETSEGIIAKSIEDIKTHYTNSLKVVASKYISQLNSCNN